MTELDKALSALWEKFKPLSRERVSVLEKAAEELLSGSLSEASRRAAESAAHKIAGSAGTFGFQKTTDTARELEHQLEGSGEIDIRSFCDKVVLLREMMESGSAPVSVEAEKPAAKSSPAVAAKHDVVLVEDDETVATLLIHSLNNQQISTHWIKDGAEAAKALIADDEAAAAKVILLDVDLPGLDGYSILRRLSERDGRKPKVIMLTMRSSEREVLGAFKDGAYEHVAKPFSVPVLIHKIKQALESRG